MKLVAIVLHATVSCGLVTAGFFLGMLLLRE
jgi:hypothetical protein